MTSFQIISALVARHKLPSAPGAARIAERGSFEDELATVFQAIFDGPDGSFDADEMRLLKALGVPREMVGGTSTARID